MVQTVVGSHATIPTSQAGETMGSKPCEALCLDSQHQDFLHRVV